MERKTDEIPLTLEWHFTHERFSYSFSKSKKKKGNSDSVRGWIVNYFSLLPTAKGGRGSNCNEGKVSPTWWRLREREFKSCGCGGASSPAGATRRGRLISAADDGALQQPGNQPDEHTREPPPLPLSQAEFCHINAAGRRDGNHAANTHLPNFCLFDFFFSFFPWRLEYRWNVFFISSSQQQF